MNEKYLVFREQSVKIVDPTLKMIIDTTYSCDQK